MTASIMVQGLAKPIRNTRLDKMKWGMMAVILGAVAFGLGIVMQLFGIPMATFIGWGGAAAVGLGIVFIFVYLLPRLYKVASDLYPNADPPDGTWRIFYWGALLFLAVGLVSLPVVLWVSFDIGQFLMLGLPLGVIFLGAQLMDCHQVISTLQVRLGIGNILHEDAKRGTMKRMGQNLRRQEPSVMQQMIHAALKLDEAMQVMVGNMQRVGAVHPVGSGIPGSMRKVNRLMRIVMSMRGKRVPKYVPERPDTPLPPPPGAGRPVAMGGMPANGNGGATPPTAQASPAPKGRKMTCPRCKSGVHVLPGAKPACKNCGFGTGGSNAPRPAAAAQRKPGKSLTCPRCSTVVRVLVGQKPRCASCGFGA